MHKLAWVFLGARASHRCRLPGEDDPDAPYDPDESQMEAMLQWNNNTGRWD